MIKSRFVLIPVSLLSVFLVVSCGKTEDVVNETVGAETTEITEITESEPEETQITETETEETELPLPWAEQNGLTFACDELEMPFWHGMILDGSVIEELGFIESTGTYSVPSVSVSESEQEGYVEYTIDYSVDDPLDAVIPYSVTDHTDSYSPLFKLYGMMDYYTGTVIVSDSDNYLYHMDEWHTFDVEYEGTNYEISFIGSRTDEVARNDAFDLDSDNWEWNCEVIFHYQIIIRVPEDYDGLILFIDLSGDDEPDDYSYDPYDQNFEISEPHVFGSEEGELIEDYQFVRVADLMMTEQ